MVKLFIERHAAVFTFSILVFILGIYAYFTLPRESMPEIKQPMIFVTTLYPGVAAHDIENLVTRVIEEEIEGLEGLDKIVSSSQQNFSFVRAEFTSDVKVEVALRRIRERVDIAKSKLPEDAEEPVTKELSSSDWPIFTVVLANPNGLERLDKTADLVEDELARIKGVLDVQVAGKPEKQVLIEVDPLKLEKYGFSMNNVIMAVQNENAAIPGGLLKNEIKNYSLSVTGEIKKVEDFKNIIVKYQGTKVPLRDLATVEFQWKDPETYSRINGEPCITMSITKRSGENIIEIVDRVKKKIKDMEPSFPEGTKAIESYDESEMITEMVLDLENNIVTALVLVLIVTIFFIGKVNSIFVSLAIPFSMLMSFFILKLLGITLNMIVLFSLVLALGMLVDNGIVIVENIFRHASMGKSRRQAALDGAHEVSGPIFASTLTTCLAFFPILFMPGLMGDILSYLPKTVIIVLSSSLLVALSINPVFCASFLRISEKNMKKITEGSGRFQKLQEWYGKKVRYTVNNPGKVFLSALAIVLLGFIINGKFGKESVFFPAMDPNAAVISIEASQGTPLDQTDSTVKAIEKIIEVTPASLKNFVSTTGQGTSDDMFAAAGEEYHKGNIMVNFVPFQDRDVSSPESIDSLTESVKQIVGADIKVRQIENGPPTGHEVSLKINGNDYSVMGKLTDTIINILKEYDELKLVDSDFEAAKPQIQIDVDREKAAYYGLSTAEIASSVRNAINGSTIGKYRNNEDEYDIDIRYKEDFRNTLNRLQNIHVVNHDDERIPLSSLAKISSQSSIGVIRRSNVQRAVEIWADFYEEVENKQEIKKEINERIEKIVVPSGYYIGAGAGMEDRLESMMFLLQAFVVAIFLVFIVLIAQFNSISEPFIIMLTVVFSFSGISWGYFLTGMNFVIIMSGIGCIALTGVVVNNGIILIDYTNILKRQGMDYHDAVVEAGKTRLRPVLLTTITTILGMVPMALGFSFDVHKFTIQFGSESGQMWVPFAWTMIYGLAFATVLTLVIVPSMLALNFKLFNGKSIGQE